MITVPRTAWNRTLAALRACGRGCAECVIYLAATLGEPGVIADVAHPRHTATRGHYEVDPGWVQWYFKQLREQRRRVVVQVHTHGGRAFHSKTDDEGALVYLPGFLSLVLPAWAAADDCLAHAHLAELQPDGRWLAVPIRNRIHVIGS